MSEKNDKNPLQEERVRLAGTLFNRVPYLTAEYKVLLGHVGGLLSNSMQHAYAKGLNDAIKFILKQNEENKDV